MRSADGGGHAAIDAGSDCLCVGNQTDDRHTYCADAPGTRINSLQERQDFDYGSECAAIGCMRMLRRSRRAALAVNPPARVKRAHANVLIGRTPTGTSLFEDQYGLVCDRLQRLRQDDALMPLAPTYHNVIRFISSWQPSPRRGCTPSGLDPARAVRIPTTNDNYRPVIAMSLQTRSWRNTRLAECIFRCRGGIAPCAYSTLLPPFTGGSATRLSATGACPQRIGR